MTVRPLRSPAAGTRNLQVITGGERPRVRGAFVWAVFAVYVVVLFLVLAYLRTGVDAVAYEIHLLEKQIQFEEARQHRLHLEKIRLESPSEIVPIAEHLLGMVLPEDVVLITAAVTVGEAGAGADQYTGQRSETADNPVETSNP